MGTYMDRLNIAQIGLGYWGPNLVRNLINNDRCNLTSIVEISEKRRNYAVDLYPDINVSDDYNNVLNDNSIDAVVIATPAATHYDIAVKALEHDKHILVEKPMAMTVKEINEIEKLEKEKNLVAMAGHTFLFNNAVRYVKESIDSGDIGNIRYIYSQRVNLGRIRSDVNAMWNLAPHDISIIQYWLNESEPKTVRSFGMDYMQPGVDDVTFITIEYPKKVIANIHVSWLDPRKIRRITIVGSKKMIIYDDIAENKIAIYDKGIERTSLKATSKYMEDYGLYRTANFNHRFGDIIIPRIQWEEPLKVEIDHFIDCINNGTTCLTGVAHAKRVVKILELASSEENVS